MRFVSIEIVLFLDYDKPLLHISNIIGLKSSGYFDNKWHYKSNNYIL